MKPQAPFTLPDKPIDGHKVVYFRVAQPGPCPMYCKIIRVTAIYHVDTPYKRLFPDFDGLTGSAYTDCWQIIEDEQTVGRTMRGWKTPWERTGWYSCYETHTQAHEEVKRRVDERIEALRKELETLYRVRKGMA